MQDKIKILFLAANPRDTSRLMIDEEMREIQNRLRAAEEGHRFVVLSEPALRAEELPAALMRHSPDIVHFSGHGTRDGELCFVDDATKRTHAVTAEQLVALFRPLSHSIRCVVLSACYSAVQAEAIVGCVPCVVGMSRAVKDEAALAFAAGFYEALAFGRSVLTAFELGQARMGLLSHGPGQATTEGAVGPVRSLARKAEKADDSVPPEREIPRLRVQEGLFPERIFLVAPRAPAQGEGSGTRRRYLREPIGSFVGRDEELALLALRMRQAVASNDACICGIRGLGGSGKTELALKVAAALRTDFPVQFLLELRGQSRSPSAPEQLLREVVHGLHPSLRLPNDRADLEQLYRESLTRQPALVLADDALDARQVAALAPPSGSALLFTSRSRFPWDKSRRENLLDLRTLPRRESVMLIRTQCGRLTEEEADTLAQRCGDLPKALQIAAGLLENDPTQKVSDYLTDLAAHRTRLKHLYDAESIDLDIDSTLALSYDALPDNAQSALRQLGVMPQSFELAAAEAVVQLDGARVSDAVALLYKRCLLDWNPENNRYLLHDLVRAMALDRLGARGATAAIEARHAAYYAEKLREANQQYWRGRDATLAALRWFDGDRAHLLAAQRWATERAPTDDGAAVRCVDFALHATHLLELRLPPADRLRWHHAAAVAARRLGDRRREARALGNVGNAHRDLGQFAEAIPYYEQRLSIAREVGDRRSEGSALGDLGVAFSQLGQLDKAVACHEQHLAIVREQKDRAAEGMALGNLGTVHGMQGQLQKAIDCHEQDLVIVREVGDRRGEGIVLEKLALALWEQGHRIKASELLGQSLRIREEMLDPRAQEVRKQLAEWSA